MTLRRIVLAIFALFVLTFVAFSIVMNFYAEEWPDQ